MEHSYTRDLPTENTEVMSTRTLMIESPPQCPSCNLMLENHGEQVNIPPEACNMSVPAYDEENGRNFFHNHRKLIENCPNINSDTDNWTEKIDRFSWTKQQKGLFDRIEHILDMDQLGRMSIENLPNECLRLRTIIEKSVSRFRRAMSSLHWDRKLSQWLHSLLCLHLPQKYMISYLDILQGMKKRIPTLVDRLLDGSTIKLHSNQLNAITESPWTPTISTKMRSLPKKSVILIVPSQPCELNLSSREKRWLKLFETMTKVEPICMNLSSMAAKRQPMESVVDQMVAITRVKILEIRKEMPDHQIILIGFGMGASIALQVAIVHKINSVVCIGFSYNTLYGCRGNLDDRILDVTTPVLFIIGSKAQRTRWVYLKNNKKQLF